MNSICIVMFPLYVYVQQLMDAEHFASKEISTRLQELTEEHEKLWDTWTKRNQLFLQCKELQVII